MADTVQEGDKVSWKWGGSQPSGIVGEVKAGEVSVTSHRGNEIKKTGDEGDPAVHIERSGNDVVKKASELNIEDRASDGLEKKNQKTDEKMREENDKQEQNGDSQETEDEPKVGDKRKADGKADANGKEDSRAKEEAIQGEKKEVKKQKTNGEAKDNKAIKETSGDTANGATNEVKKGPGRPKSSEVKKPAAKKEKRVLAVGKSERKTRSQGTV